MSLYLAGKSMREIAAVEKVSVGTVHSDVAAVRSKWRAQSVNKYTDWVDRELARIDAIERDAEEILRRSQAPEMTIDKDADGTKTKRRTRAGDTSALRIMLDCVAERCKILGLYAPKVIDAKITGQQTIKVLKNVDLDKL